MKIFEAFGNSKKLIKKQRTGTQGDGFVEFFILLPKTVFGYDAQKCSEEKFGIQNFCNRQ